MPSVYRDLILHFAWSTRGREPYITSAIERRLHRMIVTRSVAVGCPVLAINGMPDHVHLLVQMSHNLSCADFMQSIKGASSAFARDVLLRDSTFAWQHGYGVFSVSHDDIPDVIAYIKNQKTHHAPTLEEPESRPQGDGTQCP